VGRRYAKRALASSYPRSWRSSGSARSRLPVAAKTAFASAGPVTDVPGSPIPPGWGLDAQGIQNGIDKIQGTKTVVPKGGTVLVFKVR